MTLALCSGLLAGCGGGKTAAGKPAGAAGGGGSATTVAVVSGTQKPACGLVTQAEIEAAIGARVNPGRETSDPDRSVCSFTLTTAADQSVIVVSTTSSGSKATFATDRSNAPSAQALDIGDQAFVAGGQAAVLKGDTLVGVILIVRQPAPTPAAAATKVAQAVSGRL